MHKMVFKWRRSMGGSVNVSGHDPQVVGEELERLRELNGDKLTPPRVVEAAQPEESPLHTLFEWYNSEAARKYRLQQARHVLRVTVISKIGSSPMVTPLPQFVNVTERPSQKEDKNGKVIRYYESTPVAMKDPVLREQVIRKAFNELESWQKRYDAYEEFGRVFAAIDDTKTELMTAT